MVGWFTIHNWFTIDSHINHHCKQVSIWTYCPRSYLFITSHPRWVRIIFMFSWYLPQKQPKTIFRQTKYTEIPFSPRTFGNAFPVAQRTSIEWTRNSRVCWVCVCVRVCASSCAFECVLVSVCSSVCVSKYVCDFSHGHTATHRSMILTNNASNRYCLETPAHIHDNQFENTQENTMKLFALPQTYNISEFTKYILVPYRRKSMSCTADDDTKRTGWMTGRSLHGWDARLD